MWSCRAAAAVRRGRADGRRCAPARAHYTLRNAECGMRNVNAECGIRNAECGMREANANADGECGMRNAECECGMRNAECGMRNAECECECECGMRNAEMRKCGAWNVEGRRLRSIASTIGADEAVGDCACGGGGGSQRGGAAGA